MDKRTLSIWVSIRTVRSTWKGNIMEHDEIIYYDGVSFEQAEKIAKEYAKKEGLIMGTYEGSGWKPLGCSEAIIPGQHGIPKTKGKSSACRDTLLLITIQVYRHTQCLCDTEHKS